LCPECAHVLYGCEACIHTFDGDRCSKCYWDGSVSEYCKELKETADLDPPELVTGAIRDNLSFKVVAAELKKRPPSQAAAEIVVNAYRRGEAPPWLAALLLGGCRDKTGYETVREILLAAPRQLAEGYAGAALAQIGGPDALQDLIGIMLNASNRRSREGAAYGLEDLGGPEAASAILDAALSGKISSSLGGGVLGRRFPDEGVVLKLLESGDKHRVRLATEIVEGCIRSIPKEASEDQQPSLVSRPGSKLLNTLARLLEDPHTVMSPRKRETLRSWLKAQSLKPSR
jgi:hypothetical protein